MNALGSFALVAVLAIPAAAAAILALLPGYRLTARLNVAASLLTFLTALTLFAAVLGPKVGRRPGVVRRALAG